MRPTVKINYIDSSKLKLNEELRFTVTKKQAENLADSYGKMDILKTFNDEYPLVIIKCYIDEVDDSDRNFEPIW